MQNQLSFFKSLAIQWRVIRALVLREIITRYGRHNIGFFWIFIEPAMFTIGITQIWVHIHWRSTHGLPVAAYCFTGYSTILLWRNSGNRCSTAVTPNLGLLYHRNVCIIDFVASRVILEIAGCATAFTLLTFVFMAVGFIKPPENWPVMMMGYLMMCWYAGSLGVFVCACSELSEVFERIWHPLTYFMLPVSGLMFMVDWLPLRIQKMAEWVPMINGVEMIRDGYFGKAVHPHYSVLYLVSWCVGLLLVGLLFLKIVTRTVEPAAQ